MAEFYGSFLVIRFGVVDDHVAIEFHDDPFASDDDLLDPPDVVAQADFFDIVLVDLDRIVEAA